jgi:hypothetical protein
MIIVISREKMYIGKQVEQIGDVVSIKLEDALEVRELLVPVSEQHMQRMINFSTLSPFDKTTHSITVLNPTALVELEDGSDTIKAYEAFVEQLRLQNSNIVLAPAGTNFNGKFGPK